MSGKSFQYRNLNRNTKSKDALNETELFRTRAEANRTSSEHLHSLEDQAQGFEAKDGSAIADEGQRDTL